MPLSHSQTHAWGWAHFPLYSPDLCCSSLAVVGDGLHSITGWQQVWAAPRPEGQNWAALGSGARAVTQLNPFLFLWILRLRKTTTEIFRNKAQQIISTVLTFFSYLAITHVWLISSEKWEKKSWNIYNFSMKQILGFLKTFRMAHQCCHSFQNKDRQDKHMPHSQCRNSSRAKIQVIAI